jgi:hypothetical protein
MLRLLRLGVDIFVLPTGPEEKATEQQKRLFNAEMLERQSMILWAGTFKDHRKALDEFVELIDFDMLPRISAALNDAMSKVSAQMKALVPKTEPVPEPETPIQ